MNDGLNYWCKICVNSAKPKKRIPIPTAPEGQKRCSTCKEFKPTTDFGKHKGARDGLNTRCKPCVRLSKQKSRSADPNNDQKEKEYKDSHVLDQILYACKSTDKRKNRVCNLDEAYIKQLVEKQKGLNLYTNTPIRWVRSPGTAKNTGAHRGSSIDRIDSRYLKSSI